MDNLKLNELDVWFASYCRSFGGEDAEACRNYDLKELHTCNVRENIRLLAESAGLSGDRLALAEAIGLLHDVGRFEQYRRYRTFRDSDSVNHASLGIEVIRQHGLLEGLPEGNADKVIEAIRLHNAFTVPASVDGDHRLYLNLIRDADKLDIWRVFVDHFKLPDNERASAVTLGFADLPECSPEVLACINRCEMVNLSILRTLNDFKLLQISWVFDLHFPASFRLALERGHLSRLAATLPFSSEVERTLRVAWDHLLSRCV
jgi:hypothetical protein